MYKKSLSILSALVIGTIAAIALWRQFSSPPERQQFRMAASIYAGWMPWFLAAEDGTLQSKAEAAGIRIQFIQGDYIDTLNQFSAGGVDAVVVANVDAITAIAAAGAEADVILIGSYSNGNDAILLKPGVSEEMLPGRKLGLVEQSVSKYLLDRYAEGRNLDPSRFPVVNVSDSQMAAAFSAPGEELAGVVTWNPIVLQLEETQGAKRIFDSAAIPREIADLLVVRRSVLRKNPEFARVLLATWFEMVGRLDHAEKRQVTLEGMARLCGASRMEFERQLETTQLLTEPKAALDALSAPDTSANLDRIQAFGERYGALKAPPSIKRWHSSGNDPMGLLHLNSQPLREFLGKNP